jgi:hypothetical protein
VEPQTAPSALCNASAKSRSANVLAREPTANDVNGNSIGSKLLGCEACDVIVNGGPVCGTACAFLSISERDGLEPARALKAEVEAAGEKRKDFVGHSPITLRRYSAARRCLLSS